MPDFINLYPWEELILDTKARHYRKMGSGIWLLLYLISANNSRGFIRKNYEAISQETGIKSRTIRSWLKRLKDYGYVAAQRQKDGLLIKLKKTQAFSIKDNSLPDNQTKSGRDLPDDEAKSGRSYCQQTPEKPFCRQYGKEIRVGKDNANVNEDILNNANESQYRNGQKYELDSNFQPSNQEELLALDLAKGLNDTANFAFYLSASQQYPEEALRTIYREVKETPSHKIKRSRGALFCFLLKKRLRQDANPSR